VWPRTGGASSTTAASLTIPSNASSGRISATTSVGTGTSTSDFIVPPTGADIIASMRISAGSGNAGIAVGTPGKSALVLFDGALNGWYSLHFKAFDVSPTNTAVSYKVIKPDNTVLVSGTLSMGQVTSLHLPKLTAAGTHSLLLSPGSATPSTQVRLEANPAIALDGSHIATALDYRSNLALHLRRDRGQRALASARKELRTYRSQRPGRIHPGIQAGWNAVRVHVSSLHRPGQREHRRQLRARHRGAVAGTYTIVIDSGGYSSHYTNTSLQLSGPAAARSRPTLRKPYRSRAWATHRLHVHRGSRGQCRHRHVQRFASRRKRAAPDDHYKPDGSYLNSCSGTSPEARTVSSHEPSGRHLHRCRRARLRRLRHLQPHVEERDDVDHDGLADFVHCGRRLEAVRAKFTATAGQNLAAGVGGLT
jgi:hypothetical protein